MAYRIRSFVPLCAAIGGQSSLNRYIGPLFARFRYMHLSRSSRLPSDQQIGYCFASLRDSCLDACERLRLIQIDIINADGNMCMSSVCAVSDPSQH